MILAGDRRIGAGSDPGHDAADQANLGLAYAGPHRGPRDNLERSIECYTEALRFLTAEAAPSEYAATQHNLGAAYADLPTGDRAANLVRVIDCYTEALRFYTAEAAPDRVCHDPDQPGQRLRRPSHR